MSSITLSILDASGVSLWDKTLPLPSEVPAPGESPLDMVGLIIDEFREVVERNQDDRKMLDRLRLSGGGNTSEFDIGALTTDVGNVTKLINLENAISRFLSNQAKYNKLTHPNPIELSLREGIRTYWSDITTGPTENESPETTVARILSKMTWAMSSLYGKKDTDWLIVSYKGSTGRINVGDTKDEDLMNTFKEGLLTMFKHAKTPPPQDADLDIPKPPYAPFSINVSIHKADDWKEVPFSEDVQMPKDLLTEGVCYLIGKSIQRKLREEVKRRHLNNYYRCQVWYKGAFRTCSIVELESQTSGFANQIASMIYNRSNDIPDDVQVKDNTPEPSRSWVLPPGQEHDWLAVLSDIVYAQNAKDGAADRRPFFTFDTINRTMEVRLVKATIQGSYAVYSLNTTARNLIIKMVNDGHVTTESIPMLALIDLYNQEV